MLKSRDHVLLLGKARMVVTAQKKGPIRKNFSRAPMLSTKQSTSKSIVKQAIHRGPELKDSTISVAYTALPITAVFSAPTLCLLVAQGNNINNRNGRRITLKSMMFRFGTNTGIPIRILVVYDKQTNGALPGVTDVLATVDFQSPLNLANADRFVVLFDKMVNPQTTGGALDTLYRKIDLETMFSGTTNAIADIASGSIFYLMAPIVAGAATSVSQTTRVRYTDA